MSTLRELLEIVADSQQALDDHKEHCMDLPSECCWCGALDSQLVKAKENLRQAESDYASRLSAAEKAVVGASRRFKDAVKVLGLNTPAGSHAAIVLLKAVDALEVIEGGR